jgi:hypothetical protein
MEHFLLLVPGPLPGCIFMRHIILALFTGKYFVILGLCRTNKENRKHLSVIIPVRRKGGAYPGPASSCEYILGLRRTNKKENRKICQ